MENKSIMSCVFDADPSNNFNIHSVVINNEVWFPAIEVKRALGFNDKKYDYELAGLKSYECLVNETVSNLCPQKNSGTNFEERCRSFTTCKKLAFDEVGLTREDIGVDEQYRHNDITFINETAVNLLIFKSKTPEALAFQYFVCSKVLPSIRQNGFYIQSKTLTIEQAKMFIDKAAEVERKLAEQIALNNALSVDNEELKIKLDQSLTYQTVAEYCVRMKIEKSKGEIIRLGKQCKTYSAEHGYEIKKCETSKYTYNSYHIDVLNAVIED